MIISLEPDWDKIEKARNLVAEYCDSHNLPKSVAEAVVMVVSELAENAIKYGYFSSGENSITIEISLRDDNISIEVTHPVERESYDHLVELDKTIQWIRGFQDPFEAYTEKLRTVSKKALDDHSSGLGLVRIAYEGQAILDFFVDEKDMLNISAVSNRTEGV